MLLSKHHGLGNDFLIALDERNGRALEVDADLARRVCHRSTGVGADGLIHGRLPAAAESDAGYDLVMVLYNSDGSRAEMSGNGLRCLGQAVANARATDSLDLQVLTDGGRRGLRIRPSAAAGASHVEADMGHARPGPPVPTPVAESLPERHGTVDMGNPHLVVLGDDPATVDLETEGAWLEQQFADGVNVEFIAIDPDEADHVVLRVWERGAGITQACGTGACASAHYARHWGLVGDRVRVSMPGGDCEVALGDDDAVTLIGDVVWIADVSIDEHLDGRG